MIAAVICCLFYQYHDKMIDCIMSSSSRSSFYYPCSIFASFFTRFFRSITVLKSFLRCQLLESRFLSSIIILFIHLALLLSSYLLFWSRYFETSSSIQRSSIDDIKFDAQDRLSSPLI